MRCSGTRRSVTDHNQWRLGQWLRAICRTFSDSRSGDDEENQAMCGISVVDCSLQQGMDLVDLSAYVDTGYDMFWFACAVDRR